MLLWPSGRCAHLWIDWQGPEHPGDLGDAHSFLIGHTALPNQFAHPSRPMTLAPSLPATGWLAGWRSTRANRFSEQAALQDLIHMPEHDFLFATLPGSFLSRGIKEQDYGDGH